MYLELDHINFLRINNLTSQCLKNEKLQKNMYVQSKMEWSYQDYHISIVLKKIPSGAQWYCGYVRVPQKHILYCMCDYNYIQAILKQFNCGFPENLEIWVNNSYWLRHII